MPRTRAGGRERRVSTPVLVDIAKSQSGRAGRLPPGESRLSRSWSRSLARYKPDRTGVFFWGTDRLLTRPKGAHTRPLTSHRLDPVGRHRDNPANGTKTQSHSTVGRPRRRERQGGRVGGVGLEGEDVVDKVLLIMLGSSPPRRSIRAGEGGGLGQRQGGGVPRHSSCCRWLPLRGAISVVLCGS